jgi:hypothetical protein
MEAYKHGSIDPTQVIGKPLVVYIDGERRQIGTVTNAAIQGGKLYVGASLDLSEGEADLKDVAAIMEEPS